MIVKLSAVVWFIVWNEGRCFRSHGYDIFKSSITRVSMDDRLNVA